MNKEFSLIPMVKDFIRKTKSAQRLKLNGKRIKSATIDNYSYLLHHLKKYEQNKEQQIRIKPIQKLNKQQLVAEKKYWKKFYTQFTDQFYKEGCFDNYTGSMMKCLRAVFNFIEKEKMINVGNYHKDFYVTKEEIPIITLMPEQLRFLIHDNTFEISLPEKLQMVKDVFVFGCTVALRFSDIINLEWSNVHKIMDHYFLAVRSEKMDTETLVKLPLYTVAILEKYKQRKKAKKVFPFISAFWFNKSLRKICEKAGWIQILGKTRNRRGVKQQILHPVTKLPYRFCDLVSSHVMRKTAITTMLMNRVPEIVVKKISGHTGDSKSFYRYVNLVQSYLDSEIDKHYEKMELPANAV